MRVMQLIKRYWLLFVLTLQPIIDIIAYFNFATNITLISFAMRTLILLFIVLYTFIKSKDKKKFVLYMLPFALFFLLHIGNSFRVGIINLFADVRYFVMVMQMPILAICFIDYLKYNPEYRNDLKLVYILNTLIIFASIILSLIFNNFEYTYTGYGLTGWFTSANTQSMILVAICPLFLYFATRNESIIICILSHAIILFLLFLNGTKACYIALLVILIGMIYIFLVCEKSKNKFYKVAISLICLSLVLYFGNDSATFKRLYDVKENTNQNEVSIKDKIKEKIDELGKDKVYNNKDEDIDEDNIEDQDYDTYNLKKYSDEVLIEILNDRYIWREIIEIHGAEKVLNKIKNNLTSSTLSDNRLRKRVNASLFFEDSDFLTKLVGIEFSKVANYDLENDLTAIFYYYGYLGFTVYMIFILYFGWLILKMFWQNKKIIFDGEIIVYGLTLLLVLVGGEYSGAFLRKTNANIYLSILLTLIYFRYAMESLKYAEINDSSKKILSYFKKLYTKDKDSFYKIVDNNLKKKKKMFIVTANPEIFSYGERNEEVNKLLLDKDTTIISDGIGIVKSANMLGFKVSERITGIDLAINLLDSCNNNGYKLCLFGSSINVIEKMEQVIKEKYPRIKLGTIMNGYIEDKDSFFEKIKKEQPDVVLVALGMPVQEELIYKHLSKYKKGIFVGVGGSFDVISGTKKRAPKIFQKLNIEWLYRIIKEPKRLKRFYDNNIKFVLKIKKISNRSEYEKN